MHWHNIGHLDTWHNTNQLKHLCNIPSRSVGCNDTKLTDQLETETQYSLKS